MDWIAGILELIGLWKVGNINGNAQSGGSMRRG